MTSTDENTSLVPSGPGTWSLGHFIRCVDCNRLLGIDGHMTINCGAEPDLHPRRPASSVPATGITRTGEQP